MSTVSVQAAAKHGKKLAKHLLPLVMTSTFVNHLLQ
jgi:hypothetical protein